MSAEKLVFRSRLYYSWTRKYVGLGLHELRELRQLREENRNLKTLVAVLHWKIYLAGGACKKA